MFTGIIEEIGHLVGREAREAGLRLGIACSAVLADARRGDSIAVNGACLTAIELTGETFWADVAPETLKRTNLGDLQVGSEVNLERPLRANGRLDGHFVLGHVDGTAELTCVEALGDNNWWLRIRLPEELTRYVVSKGSLAVDGISLTVAEIDGETASFTVIPYTYEHTALPNRVCGSHLNIEVDILAKHLEKLAGRTA